MCYKILDLVCDLCVYVCLCVHVCIHMPLSLCARARLNRVRARTCTSVCFSSSPHAVPDRLRLRVNRISLQEYDRLQYDKERLRDICKALKMKKKQKTLRWPLHSLFFIS